MTIRGIQGALILSACFQMVIGFFGFWRNAARLVNATFLINFFNNSNSILFVNCIFFSQVS